jgi:hypothetical protein
MLVAKDSTDLGSVFFSRLREGDASRGHLIYFESYSLRLIVESGHEKDTLKNHVAA